MLGALMSDLVQVRAWLEGRYNALEIGEFAFHSAWLRRYTASRPQRVP